MFAFQNCTVDGTNTPLNRNPLLGMIFFPTLSDFGLILEANIHVLTGETSCFLPQPNSGDSEMTQQLGLREKRKWQMSRERCSWGNISSQFSHGSWRLFFLFLFFLFFFFLLFWLRESFIHGWVTHFCPLWKGRRELRNQRKDHYDVGSKGKLNGESCLRAAELALLTVEWPGQISWTPAP